MNYNYLFTHLIKRRTNLKKSLKLFFFLMASITVFLNPSVSSAQTYCTPIYSTGCSFGDNMSAFKLLGDVLPGINNTTPTCAPTYYTYFPNMTATLTAGQAYSGNVNTTYSGNYENIRIWIDYNNDGVFQSTETIATLADQGSGNSGAFTFTVPITQAAGTYRLRARLVYSTPPTSIDPCNSESYGEAQDYNVTIIASTPCTGTPSAGTLDSLGVCASVPFSISPTGATLAGNLEFQWQSRVPAGTGTWTNITGATSLVYNSTGIAVPTDYRFISKCTTSNLSDTTNISAVTINAPNTCYCIPVTTSSSYYINNFSTTGGNTNISNLNSGYSLGGYGDFTATQIVSQLPGNSVNFTGNFGSSTSYSFGVKIWVDWNQNGSFNDPGEQVYVTSSYVTSLSGTIAVPMTAVPGNTRMRIGANYLNSTGPANPCENFGSGEYEDYTFNVIPLTPCTGMPDAGTLPATMLVCPNVAITLTSTGATQGGNLVGQWQSRVPAGTGTWANVPGANYPSYYNATGISVPTDYRFILTCTPSGLSDTTSVIALSIKPANQCYCDPGTTTSTYYINNFSTTGGIDNISNLNSGYSTGGYGDFTGTDTVSHVPGNSVSFSGTFGSGSYGVKIWVDWNQDGNFTGAGEQVFATTSYVTSFTGSIPIPLSAVSGNTRMRVGANYSNSSGPSTPCEIFTYGEYEDYTFKVIPLQSCSSASYPTSATAESNIDTVCVSGDINLNMTTAMPPVSGLTYQWQSSPNATGPWTNVGPALTTPPYTAIGVNTPRFYRLQVICSNVPVVTTNVLPILIANPSVTNFQDGQHCGPGTVDLSGTASVNSVLKWYQDETGGLPLGTGNTFTTPFLNETDTFYVGAGLGGSALPPTMIGTGTSSTTSNPSPFYNLYDGNRSQYLVRASELIAAGFSAGTITSIGFDVVSSGNPLQQFNISMGQTTQTTLSTSWITGLTEVYSVPMNTPIANQVNEYTFTTPFVWDGVSNVVIQTCYFNGSWGGTYAGVKYTTGLAFNGTHYLNQDGNSAICTTTSPSAGSTLTSRPNIQFKIISGCESPRQAVIAHIRPFPEVDLGADIDACVDLGASFNLDAGTYSDNPTYLWQDNTTNQSRQVSTSGTYSVVVTNQFGCSGSDTVNVNIKLNPIINLGNDTTLCEGATLTLDAGNQGISYFWNTGEVTSEIEIDQSGTYKVIVTNSQGCIGQDSIVIVMSGFAPTLNGIQVTNISPLTFKFKAMNPVNDVTYDWDFGDGSVHSSSPNPTHTYYTPGNYLVKVKILGTCGEVYDSTYVSILGVDDISKESQLISIYPNPTSQKATILSKGDLLMQNVDVYNTLGQKVYTVKLNEVKEFDMHLTGFASGLYTVHIFTNKGVVTRKLEIIK